MIKKFLLLFVVCWGCGKSAPVAEGKKPVILVSIAPYKFLAERIAGPEFEVQTVVPQGANPHAFEPTSHQVSQMGRGVVWFRIGEPFEEKILPVLKGRTPITVQDLREGISLIEEGHPLACKHCCMDHYDRHIWLSPKLASEQARIIEKVMSERFPEQAQVFKENLAQLAEDLTFLDQEIAAILEPVKERVILVSHPAFGYFCKDYEFKQLSVEYEGKDPRPKHLEAILKQASGHAEVALALPQYNNKGAQMIAERLHVPVHLIDPYSSEYFDTMRKLARLIADPVKTHE